VDPSALDPTQRISLARIFFAFLTARLPHDGIALNEHFGGDGAMIYKHACAIGCKPTVVANDRLAIDDARSNGQGLAPTAGAGMSLGLPPKVPIAVRTCSAKTTECCDVTAKLLI
jgi:hypothetical protein